MNPGNLPLDVPGSDAAAIENTASVTVPHRENGARAILHRGLSPATFNARSSCYCPHCAADKDSGYWPRDEQSRGPLLQLSRLATALAPSLLCGIAAKENASMRLIHTVYEPAGEGPHPTLIAMHGFGANALDLLGLAPYIADGRFMVICPQGPMEVPIGPTRGYAWFPIRMGASPDRNAIDDANKMVTEFLNEALQKYPVDRKKLVVLGFSQGAATRAGILIKRDWSSSTEACSGARAPTIKHILATTISGRRVTAVRLSRGAVQRVRRARATTFLP